MIHIVHNINQGQTEKVYISRRMSKWVGSVRGGLIWLQIFNLSLRRLYFHFDGIDDASNQTFEGIHFIFLHLIELSIVIILGIGNPCAVYTNLSPTATGDMLYNM